MSSSKQQISQQQFLAVAFDMDGLMFDTEDVYWKTASEVLRRRGCEYTQELCHAIMGRPPKYCFELMIDHFGLTETWEELHAESEEVFIRLLDSGFKIMPGLIPLLKTVEECGLPKSVCTSSSQKVAQEVIGRVGLLDRFGFILAFEDIVNGKPNPEIYLKAAGRFGIEPNRMLVFEDSASGVWSALDAGSFVVAVRAEHNRAVDLSHASLVVERLDAPEVLNLFQ